MLRIQEYLRCFDDLRVGLECLKKNHGVTHDYRYIFSRINHSRGHGRLEDCVLMFHNTKIKPDSLARDVNGLGLYKTNLELAFWGGRLPISTSKISETNINWRRSYAFDEPLGHRLMVYYHGQEWHVATDETPNGISSSSIRDPEWHELLKDSMARCFDPWYKPFELYKDNCFVFHVTEEPHDYPHFSRFPNLVLTKIISRRHATELRAELLKTYCADYKIPRPNVFSISGPRMLKSALKNMYFKAPALVLRDKSGEAIAYVKNPISSALSAANEVGGKVSAGHVVNIYRACRNDEDIDRVCLAHPDFAEAIYLLQDVEGSIWAELVNLYNEANKCAENTAFAKRINSHPLAHILFDYRKAKIKSIQEGISELNNDKFIEYVDLITKNEFAELISELKSRRSHENS